MAAARNDANERFLIPNSSSVESVYAKLSPNTLVNASAADEEMVECPQVYSGNAGVCRYGRQFMSMYLLITVSGRTVLYLYFTAQHCIKASNKAILVFAKAYTVVG